MKLSECLIVARPNAKSSTIEPERARRVNRTLYLLLAGLAACRKGELEKLEWTHVDLARNVISVPKSKVRIGGTKMRVIPVHPVLRPWLEALSKTEGRVVESWGSIGRDPTHAHVRASRP